VHHVCVDSSLLGTKQHLVFTGTGFTWCRNVPKETWHLSGEIKRDSDWCLDTLFRLHSIVVDLLPPLKFVNAMKAVARDQIVVPWQMIMPSTAHRAFTKNVIEKVVEAMSNLPTNYYRDTWVPGNTVLRSLQRARVDPQRVQSLIVEHVGNVSVVETFVGEDDGFASPVTYDRFGTLTGRLTVKHGPGILTLKREYRDIIVSSTPGGSVVSIDFAALEARVLLYENGRRCDDPDLYGMIARELGYERNAVKGAVISELYGSSKAALGAALGIEGKDLVDFIKRVKTYFNTQLLLKRIKKQFIESGRIVNRYGRQIGVDDPLPHVFINYYAQSTGVDVTLMGFSKIVTMLAESCPGVRPLFVLHDALILDVPKVHIDEVYAIRSVTVPGYVQSYPLKVTKFASCTP